MKPTPVYQSQSYSPPSVGMSHATVTEGPAITNHLYREPRYPSSRASESLPSTNVSISGAVKLNPTEVRVRLKSDRRCASCLPRSILGARLLRLRHDGASTCSLRLIVSFPLTTMLITAYRVHFSQGTHNSSNHFSAMRVPLPPNQVSFSHSTFLALG